MMIVSLYSVMMDPEYWGDPETFRPERFLNTDGSYRKDERFIPFGKGERGRKDENLENAGVLPCLLNSNLS